MSMANPNDTRLAEEANRELVDGFRQVIELLWGGVVALIGENSAMAMFQSALQDAKRQHPLLSGIDIDRTGVRVDRLRVHVLRVPQPTLRDGLLAFIDALEGLMVDLAGNVVMHKVEPLIQQFKQRLGRE
jgi:hypothetical protein